MYIDIEQFRYTLNRFPVSILSVKSGVSVSTIINIKYGKTKMPQYRTLKKLLPITQMKLVIKPI